jgi:alkaline phosphatase
VVALDDAVAAVLAWVEAESSFDDTLVIVTADHETGGYEIDGDSLDGQFFTASPDHTRQPVPAYARGPGAEHLPRACRVADLFWLLTGRLDQTE